MRLDPHNASSDIHRDRSFLLLPWRPVLFRSSPQLLIACAGVRGDERESVRSRKTCIFSVAREGNPTATSPRFPPGENHSRETIYMIQRSCLSPRCRCKAQRRIPCLPSAQIPTRHRPFPSSPTPYSRARRRRYPRGTPDVPHTRACAGIGERMATGTTDLYGQRNSRVSGLDLQYLVGG